MMNELVLSAPSACHFFIDPTVDACAHAIEWHTGTVHGSWEARIGPSHPEWSNARKCNRHAMTSKALARVSHDPTGQSRQNLLSAQVQGQSPLRWSTRPLRRQLRASAATAATPAAPPAHHPCPPCLPCPSPVAVGSQRGLEVDTSGRILPYLPTLCRVLNFFFFLSSCLKPDAFVSTAVCEAHVAVLCSCCLSPLISASQSTPHSAPPNFYLVGRRGVHRASC